MFMLTRKDSSMKAIGWGICPMERELQVDQMVRNTKAISRKDSVMVTGCTPRQMAPATKVGGTRIPCTVLAAAVGPMARRSTPEAMNTTKCMALAFSLTRTDVRLKDTGIKASATVMPSFATSTALNTKGVGLTANTKIGTKSQFQ